MVAILNIFIVLVRGNQLPVSAARWQHSSQIFLQLLFGEKLQNFLKNQQPLNVKKKV
jgi:hypothetical protein